MNYPMEVEIEHSWKLALKELFQKPYFDQIATHIKAEKELHKTIYPKGAQIFNAFEQTPYDQVKVIIENYEREVHKRMKRLLFLRLSIKGQIDRRSNFFL